MTVKELCEKLSLKVVTGDTEKEFHGVYVGDLLSRAMSHVKTDNLWVTIMCNANVVAVASLCEASAVILAEGVELLPEAIAAAKENDITVLASERTVYDLCIRIHQAGAV